MKSYFPNQEKLPPNPAGTSLASAILLVLALYTTLRIEVTTLYARYFVPGWHTLVFPRHYAVSALALLWLYVVSTAYFFLGRKRIQVNAWLTVAHVAITTIFIYLCYYTRFSIGSHPTISEPVYYTSLCLFVATQFAFIYWFARSLRGSRK